MKLSAFITRLPRGFVLGMGRAIGLTVYLLDTRHRRIVRRNLDFVFPEWSEKRVRKVSRRVFQNTAITLMEICQIYFLSKEDVIGKARFRGAEHLEEAAQHPMGAIVVSAHLGNWELAGVFGTCYLGIPSAFVARVLNSGFLDRRLNSFRTRFGNIILDKKGAVPKMVRLLKRGWIVGLLVDQSTSRSEGVEVEFFGKKVTSTPAAALLARRYGCPVVPVFGIRESDGSLTVEAQPALSLVSSQDRTADLVINTQIINDVIEEMIRAYPDQWFWFHKRWKHHYPFLYPEDMARKNRKRERRRKKEEARWAQ